MIKRLILAITALSFRQMPQQVQSNDPAQYLTLARDQAGTNKTLIAISSTPGTPEVPGLVYDASLLPAFPNYTAGASFVMIPDVPTQPGATINIGGVGPIVILGTCSRICLLLYAPATSTAPLLPAAMVVH